MRENHERTERRCGSGEGRVRWVASQGGGVGWIHLSTTRFHPIIAQLGWVDLPPGGGRQHHVIKLKRINDQEAGG